MNGDAKEQAENVRVELHELFPDSEMVVEKQITASLAVHTGPGLIGVCIFSAD